jgi:hypothetical protein
MSTKHNLYTGRSGQMAVMAEFLRRGYNVAVPEIDIGEDIFVVRDADGVLSRIQVKSAIAKGKKQPAGTFNVPEAQLRRPHKPELHYIFALHYDGLWREFVIIERDVLKRLHDVGRIGNMTKERKLVLYLSFSAQDIVCSQTSLQAHRGDWSPWPVIQH